MKKLENVPPVCTPYYWSDYTCTRGQTRHACLVRLDTHVWLSDVGVELDFLTFITKIIGTRFCPVKIQTTYKQ